MPTQNDTCQGRKRYKTDVTDEQWALVAGLIPPAVAKSGRAPTDVREILNTLLYQNHTGCQWDMLPHDLAARSTAFDYYQAWQGQGVWERIVDALREQVRVATPRAPTPTAVRPEVQVQTAALPADLGQATAAPQIQAQRAATPSFVIMDSQSAKTTEVGGEQRG